MYSYLRHKKQIEISFEETKGFFEGKMPEQYRPIRDVFFASVCRIIEDGVRNLFEVYFRDNKEQEMMEQEFKAEENQIVMMHPVEITKNYLWPKIVAMGELKNYHKEAAKSWFTMEQAVFQEDLGQVVVLTHRSHQLFLAHSQGATVDGEDPRDFFDIVDLKRIYERDTATNDNQTASSFRRYVDSIASPVKKNVMLHRVINSQEWSKYFVMKKSKERFADAFSMRKAPIMCAFIENEMLVTRKAGEKLAVAGETSS
jgi:hypothetical protein